LPRNNYYFCSRNDIGNLVEAGLPNIEGNIRTNDFGWNPNGAFTIDQRTTENFQGTNSSSTIDWVKFRASVCNSIYGNSDTVQPLSVSCYLMFYIN